MDAADIQALQRSVGNQALAPLLQRAHASRVVQRKRGDLKKLRAAATKQKAYQDVEKTDSAKEGVAIGGDVSNLAKATTTLGEESTKTKDPNTGKESAAPGAALSSGVASTIGSFFAIAKAVKGLKEAKEKSGAEKAGAGLELGSALFGGAAAGSKVVAESTAIAAAGSDAAKETKTLAGVLSGFAGGVDGFKDTFFAVKKAVDLVRKRNKLSAGEKATESMEVVKKALEGAKSGVESAKSFLETFTSGPSAAVNNAVPGLGIAVGGMDIFIRGFYLVEAAIHRHDMRKKKWELKLKLGGEKGKTLKEQAEAILKDPKATDEEKAGANEYLLSRGLQYVNVKRVRRAILKIAVAMAKIAGEITTLAGVAAPAGVAIKVGAVAVDVGAGFFRKFKQWGRDKAAKKAAKKPGSKSVFNVSKSTEAKNKRYNEQVDLVLDMIWKATEQYKDAEAMPEEPAEDRQAAVEAAEAALKRSRAYLNAVGFSVAQLHREAADPTEMKKKMIAALKKRE